ncbi:MAG: DUF3298 domain-containing protein [Muribaculaceae bacterium]|nr:DUF3298 domain-containing protein [Muribaculaceae bacterium]
MNHKLAYFAIVMLLVSVSTSCSCSNSASKNGDVTVATDSITETGSFKKSNGEVCEMKVNLVVSYPQAYKDSVTLEKLQKLFATHLLKAPKEVTSIKDAMQHYAKSTITRNTPSKYSQASSGNDSINGDIDEIDIDKFESTINIKVVYNDNELITFCREEAIDKNGQRTSTSHHYTSFDLKEMKKISLSDLIREDSYDKVTAQLKSKLMDDKGASNEDELNDMGYFNLPNLAVTNNFFFTSKGVTWSYDSSVIAVASVGEPTINIDYDDLEQFYSDNSVLKRL